MSTLENIISGDSRKRAAKQPSILSLYSRFLKLLSSPRLGVVLLCLLISACLIGMLVMQQNVDGFDRYFADLAPYRRQIFTTLGFFDIYRSWYFNALLAALSLNIILASVDRFPRAWIYVSKPCLTVPLRWLKDQHHTASITVDDRSPMIESRIADAMKRSGWKPVSISQKNGLTYIFGQRGAWNRLGAYCVHVGLLTIFAGGFLTAQFSSTGQLPLAPGVSTGLIIERVADLDRTREKTKQLPFVIHCSDLQQRLIKKEGSLAAQNTIDWTTRFTISDETGIHEAVVQMNRPFDYRGYRFFQSSFTPIGRAREVSIAAIAANGGQTQMVTIPRNGVVELADGTSLRLDGFRGNFRMAEEDTAENTTDYKNPAAVLKVIQKGGPSHLAYALGPSVTNAPTSNEPVGGYFFQLIDFEKVADQHVLSVQRDPGASVVYVGFGILFLSLLGVFGFSHQRVWAAIDRNDERTEVTIGGHSNRNSNAFSERFRKFEDTLRSSKV